MIAELERWAVPFAREADGHLSQRFLGAHWHRCTCFVGDYTGLEIIFSLLTARTNNPYARVTVTNAPLIGYANDAKLQK
jgi:succinate dehydrogenase/fumarate reductase flavoprotein subunit